MSNVRLTRRGKIVVTILALIAALLFGYATHDVCWVGTDFPNNTLGYGSCEAMFDYIMEGKQ